MSNCTDLNLDFSRVNTAIYFPVLNFWKCHKRVYVRILWKTELAYLGRGQGVFLSHDDWLWAQPLLCGSHQCLLSSAFVWMAFTTTLFCFASFWAQEPRRSSALGDFLLCWRTAKTNLRTIESGSSKYIGPKYNRGITTCD